MNDSLDLSWFDLNNYSRFENMTIREWAYEINAREYLNSKILNDNIEDTPEAIQGCINELNGVLNKEEVFAREMNQSLSRIIPEELARNQEKTASIRPLHFFDLWQVRFFNKNIVKKHWNACKRVQQRLYKDSNSIAFEYIDAIDESSFKRLGVDLNSSDEQIKADFSSWLNHARKQQKETLPEKMFTQKKFNIWMKYQYIPCLDLILVAKLQKKT